MYYPTLARHDIVDLEYGDDFYPETDGVPMAESDFQRRTLTYAVDSLDLHFENRPDMYISGNMLIYYEKGNREAVVSPDVFGVKGVPKHDRVSYKVWEEGKPPDFVLEITSRSTQKQDEVVKADIYERMGVREYMQHDPTGDYLYPALKGRRLNEHGEYELIPISFLPDGTPYIYSEVLELELRLEHGRLRFYDPVQQTYLLSLKEQKDRADAAEQRIKLLEEELSRRLRGGNGNSNHGNN